MSRLARRGSGSAARSIPSGFVEWFRGDTDTDSYAISIAPPEHWDLMDCIVILDDSHKTTGSTEGHQLALTSPLQQARVKDCDRRLENCRDAIKRKDFDALARVIEVDSNLLHAVAMTSNPPVFYWLPETITVMQTVIGWRKAGIPVAYTIDAGPNVHVICEASSYNQVYRA